MEVPNPTFHSTHCIRESVFTVNGLLVLAEANESTSHNHVPIHKKKLNNDYSKLLICPQTKPNETKTRDLIL